MHPILPELGEKIAGEIASYRELLAVVEEERRILLSGDHQLLFATGEKKLALAQRLLAQREARRELMGRIEIGGRTTLRLDEFANLLPPPERQVFRDHTHTLATLAERLASQNEANQGFLREALDTVEHILGIITRPRAAEPTAREDARRAGPAVPASWPGRYSALPSIYSMMDIARWALNSSTRQLDTVSHNVANVNTEGYSRQEAVLATRSPEYASEGWYGRGAMVDNVVQYVDRLILERITDKTSEREYYSALSTQLSRIETLANEADDSGLGQMITEFFSAWEEVANNPESTAVREVLTETTSNLVSRLQNLMSDLQSVDRDMDTYITDATEEANSICRRIAALNEQIVAGEASGHTANDLRDERTNQLNSLSELMDIQWFEDANGAVTVIAGQGLTLVETSHPDANDVDPLVFRTAEGTSESQLFWRGTDVQLGSEDITGGQIGAWLTMRETELPEAMDFLNDLSHNLIAEVNLLHSQGAGTELFSSVTGSYASSSATTAFGSASNDLAYADLVKNGSFDLWVYQDGTRRQYTIGVTTDDTMTSLVDKINLAMGGGVTPNTNPTVNPVASLDSQNRLCLNASGGIEFGFANDTSQVLAAVGVNTFFTGSSATSIAINETITANVNHIAAGRLGDDGEHATGDNSNALDLADLKDKDTMNGGTQTFNEAIISRSSSLGTKVASAKSNYNFAETTTDELLNQRDTVSSVNLDEEMVNLIRYQRSYQMAAKMISVADSLLESLLAIKN